MNKQMNIFKFHYIKQFEDELFDDFISRLRDCVVTREFGTGDVDNQMKSQIANLLIMGKTTEVVDVYLNSAGSRRDSACSSHINGMSINRLNTDRNQYTINGNSK
jgi:hypothetical protein